MGKLAATVGAILALVLVIVIGIGVWQFNWFLAAKNADKQGQVDQHKYSRQVGLIAAINNDAETIGSIDVQITTASGDQAKALVAQRKSTLDDLCANAGNLNDTAQASPSAQRLIQSC